MSNIFNNNISSSIFYSTWILFVLTMCVITGVFNSKNIRFGPPKLGEKPIFFFGNEINTWNKIIILFLYIFINQIVNTYHRNLFKPWMTNNVYDDKVKKVNMKKNNLLLLINLENIFGWVSYFIDLNILLSMEFQFIICRLIASVIANNYVLNNKYLKHKKFK